MPSHEVSYQIYSSSMPTQVKSSEEPQPHLNVQQICPPPQPPEQVQAVGEAVGLVCVCDDNVVTGMKVELVGVAEATLLILLELEGHGNSSELPPFGSQTGPSPRNGENGAAQIDAAMARAVTMVGMKERIMKTPVNLYGVWCKEK